MTIGTDVAQSGPYFPNGVVTSFPFGISISDPSDISVIWIAADGTESVISPASYTVTISASEPGGTVVFGAAPSLPAAGSALWIVLDPEFEQQDRYSDEGPFNQSLLEGSLDRQARLSIWLKARANRALTLPFGETGGAMPSAAARAGRFLAFDPSGNPVAAGGSGADGSLRADLAGSSGAALVGANDGAGGTLWASVAGFIAHLRASTGAGIIGFVATGLGAVVRSIQSRMRETVSVKDYGAVMDGVTDDGDALEDALNALVAAGGGTLTIPFGRLRCKRRITITCAAAQSIRIKGAGRDMSVLDFSDAASLGLQFISTTTTANRKPWFELTDFSIETSRKNAGTAVRISYANDQNFLPSVTIKNFYIGGALTRVSDSGADFGYWTRHVHLSNARNSRIMNFEFSGEINLTPISEVSVLLDGESTATQLIDGLIIEGGTYGLLATGTTEGVSVINCDILYSRYGARHDTAGEPQFTMIGGSVNCSEVNVWLTNSLQSVISGTLMYAAGELSPSGPWPEWRGVLIDGANSRHNKIIGCTFSKNAPRSGDTCTGIDFAQGRDCVASGNTFEGLGPGNQLTFGIQVRPGFQRARIGDDNLFDSVVAPVIIDATATGSHHQPLVKAGNTGAITTGTAVSFPQPFPNACISAIAVHSGTNTAINVTTSNRTPAGFTINFSGGGSAVFDWQAVGN